MLRRRFIGAVAALYRGICFDSSLDSVVRDIWVEEQHVVIDGPSKSVARETSLEPRTTRDLARRLVL